MREGAEQGSGAREWRAGVEQKSGAGEWSKGVEQGSGAREREGEGLERESGASEQTRLGSGTVEANPVTTHRLLER